MRLRRPRCRRLCLPGWPSQRSNQSSMTPETSAKGGTELQQVWRIVDDELIAEQPRQVIAFLFGATRSGR
jgi:hypothetical protein